MSKPTNVVTLGADNIGWNRFFVMKTEVNPGLFDAILVEGKGGYQDDKTHFIPQKREQALSSCQISISFKRRIIKNMMYM